MTLLKNRARWLGLEQQRKERERGKGECRAGGKERERKTPSPSCVSAYIKSACAFFFNPFHPFCLCTTVAALCGHGVLFFFPPLWLSQRGAAETLLSAETCDWEDVSRPLLPPRGASDGGVPSLSIRQRNQSPITETVDHRFGKMAQAAALDRNNPLMSCCFQHQHTLFFFFLS